MRWRFQHTCRWIWRFRGCLRHSPKGKKPNIFKFNNAFTSTLAILAALDSNLVANFELWKYSPSFICTSAAWNRWAF